MDELERAEWEEGGITEPLGIPLPETPVPIHHRIELPEEASDTIGKDAPDSRSNAAGGSSTPHTTRPRVGSDLFNDVILSITKVLELDEPEKIFHSWRVAALSYYIAEEMALLTKDDVFYAGLVHDIGAIGIRNDVLHLSRGTEIDRALLSEILQYPRRCARIISLIPGLETAAGFVLKHQENLIGSGYPLGKKAAPIPLESSILHLANLFDRRLQEDTFLTRLDLLDELGRLRGVEFPGQLVDALEAVFSNRFAFESYLVITELYLHLKNILGEVTNRAFGQDETQLESFLRLFATIIDAKHRYTGGHSLRVAEYASVIAIGMNLPKEKVKEIYYAGLLHDAGKVRVPREILDKPGYLNPQEMKVVRSHPIYSRVVISTIPSFAEIGKIASWHHERVDGKGYPDRLTGDILPMESKILACSDAVDACTTDRSYQAHRTLSDAKKILNQASGTQFDRGILESALNSINEDIVSYASAISSYFEGLYGTLPLSPSLLV